jgi:hypothetical protein
MDAVKTVIANVDATTRSRGRLVKKLSLWLANLDAVDTSKGDETTKHAVTLPQIKMSLIESSEAFSIADTAALRSLGLVSEAE